MSGESPEGNPSSCRPLVQSFPLPRPLSVSPEEASFGVQWGLWEALVLPEPTSHLSSGLPGVPVTWKSCLPDS